LRFCEQCAAPLGVVDKPVDLLPASRRRPRRRRFRWLALGATALLVAIIAAVVLRQMPEVTRREAVTAADEIVESWYPEIADVEPAVYVNEAGGRRSYSVEYPIEYEIETTDGSTTASGGIVILIDAETGETQILGAQ
jgi:hypothetical protein